MVVNKHQFPFFKIGVNSAGGIADQKFFDAQQFHYSYRERNVQRAITFVQMESAVHHDHFFPFQSAINELATMKFYRGGGKIGDEIIPDFLFNLHMFQDPSQATAEDYANFGGVEPTLL